jgi:pimeloyl-ACP methyl ester carboxylesterase
MRWTSFEGLPTGPRHPVIIFPGLATDSRFTSPLARHCTRLGYSAHHWGRGWNRGPQGDPEAWLLELAEDVRDHVRNHGRTATLIGWSLGGVYAREIAKRIPRQVRQVITIGSPVAGTAQHTNVAWLYRLLSGRHAHVDRRRVRRLRDAPPVPTTSIYSRSDGVVAWRACRLPRAERTENIEVESSHLGLVFHPAVLAIVADRLSQREGRWQPYARQEPARRAA